MRSCFRLPLEFASVRLLHGVYERVWRDNRRRHLEPTPTWDVLHAPHDYKAIFIGGASMSPHEIVTPGGSVEHWNEEAGITWLQRVLSVYPERCG